MEESNVHKMSKTLQHEELKHVEENIQISFVPPSSIIVQHEKLQKFVPFTKKSVALFDIYTYYSKEKN